jgi:UDPglucose--hexose-1-phosphate uridylyltransferase
MEKIMSELRYNPFLKDWVMVAANRQNRPDMPSDYCPFCPGSGKVPEYYDVYAYDNDFPVIVQQWSAKADEGEFFKKRGTYGKCEVLLYHSSHHAVLPELPAEHIRKLVDLWCCRNEELSKDTNIQYIYIFENRGKEAGVTMPHPHGQLYAFGWIPKVIQTELDSSREYFNENGRCLMCDLIANEKKEQSRMVYENESMAVFVPFFTVWPYGTYIAAKSHAGNLMDLDEQQKNDLADALRCITGAYDTLFDSTFPYMMGIHQTPCNTVDASGYYHFHIEFYPPLRARDKQYLRASCETGAGAYCNVTLPEETSSELRQALARFLKWNETYAL